MPANDIRTPTYQNQQTTPTGVMNTSKYIEEGIQFLEYQTTYQNLENDPSKEITETAQQLLNKYKDQGKIDEWTRKHDTMNLEDVRTQRLYFLCKVHKTPYKCRFISCRKQPHTQLAQVCHNLWRLQELRL